MLTDDMKRAMSLITSEENIRTLEKYADAYDQGSTDGATYGKACYAIGFADAALRAEKRIKGG